MSVAIYIGYSHATDYDIPFSGASDVIGPVENLGHPHQLQVCAQRYLLSSKVDEVPPLSFVVFDQVSHAVESGE